MMYSTCISIVIYRVCSLHLSSLISTIFRLPLSSTFQGLQLEMDMVHDPVKPSYQSTVIKLNYFNGKKYNILEVGTDMRGNIAHCQI